MTSPAGGKTRSPDSRSYFRLSHILPTELPTLKASGHTRSCSSMWVAGLSVVSDYAVQGTKNTRLLFAFSAHDAATWPKSFIPRHPFAPMARTKVYCITPSTGAGPSIVAVASSG